MQREEEKPAAQQLEIVNTQLCEQLKNLKGQGDVANAAMTKLKQEKMELAETLVDLLYFLYFM